MKAVIILLTFVLSLGTSHTLYAYSKETHRKIGERAANAAVSSVDKVLKNELGMLNGVEEKFYGRFLFPQREVWKLIGQGAFNEDEPPWRVVYHFHNPLAPWDSAGLLGFSSSLFWQQIPNQNHTRPVGVSASWQNARQAYALALTSLSPVSRQQSFGKVFLTLGHLTHLLQDASVPPHVRNDAHLTGSDSDGYERWVNDQVENNPDFFQFLLASPFLPSSAIFTPTNHPQAPVPIARLIDTDRYTGVPSPTLLTGSLIGLAEYTNANFLSDDTIFGEDFSLPPLESLGPGFSESEGAGQRQYFPKDGAYGEAVQYFVAEGVWWERLRRRQVSSGDYILTDRVYQDYAKLLLPRAVGYSAALLDYFFRGQIDLMPDSSNAKQYLIKNLSTEDMNGVFELYYDDTNDERHLLATWTTAEFALTGVLAAGAEMPVSGFDFPIEPAPQTPGEYLLVFKGQLGDEGEAGNATQFAVVGKVVNGETPAGLITTAGGDAWGFAAPGDGGAVVLETGAGGPIIVPSGALIVPAGQVQTLNGEWSYTEIRIAGMLRLTGDTILYSHGPVVLTGLIDGQLESGDGVNLTIFSKGPVVLAGYINVSGHDGEDLGDAPRAGGTGGSIIIRTASTVPFTVPTIITRGGDAHLTDTRTPATAFAGARGGNITLITHGSKLVFDGEELLEAAVDPLPPQHGAHTLPTRTTFQHGLLTTGGYGGQFGGEPGSAVVAGAPGGAGGDIAIECVQPAEIQFVETDLFTGGNIDVLLKYRTALVFKLGEQPKFQDLVQRTGALGGQGSNGSDRLNGGNGGPGGAAGAVLVNPQCQLTPQPVSFTTPPRLAPLFSNVDPRSAISTKLPIVEAFEAEGNRLYTVQAFGGGGGIPGGSAFSVGQCSVTREHCYVDVIPTTCPLAPDTTGRLLPQVCLGKLKGDPGLYGPLGADGPVSCAELGIPATLARPGLLCP